MTRCHASWVVALVLACALPAYARGQEAPPQPVPSPPGSRAPGPQAPPPSPWSVAWTASLGGLARAAAATDQTSIYVPLRSGKLVAVAADSGAVRWTTATETDVAPAASAGQVFVATSDALESLSAETGERVWRAPLPSPPAVAPLVSGTVVIVVLESGDVLAVDRSSGATTWQQALGGAPVVVSSVSDDRVLAGLSDGQVTSLEVLSGRIAWRQRLPAEVTALRADRGRAFAGSRDNFLYCLDAQDGRIRWRWRTGGDVIGVPEVDVRRVYFVSLDNMVRALDRENGAQRWKAGLPTRPLGGPLLLGSELIVSGVSAELQVIDVSAGKLKRAIGLDAEPSSAALAVAPVAGRTDGASMLLITRDGKLRRFVRASGEPSATDPASPSPPAQPVPPPVLP